MLRIIQLGITLADENGELAPGVCTWQFNFSFSIKCVPSFLALPSFVRYPCSPSSATRACNRVLLALRKRQGGGDGVVSSIFRTLSDWSLPAATTCTPPSRSSSSPNPASTSSGMRSMASTSSTLANSSSRRGSYCWTRCSGCHSIGTLGLLFPLSLLILPQWKHETDNICPTSSGYDFGYLLKIVSCLPLPPTETEFFELLKIWFPCIWDIKVRALLLLLLPFRSRRRRLIDVSAHST